MYKLRNLLGGIQDIVRSSDGAFIPFDPANTDFQEYQKWIALGNQPLPADEPALP